MKPTDATAPALAGALGLPVSKVEYNALGDGNEGALSAMCKIHLEFPEENEMTRELSDVVIKVGSLVSHIRFTLALGAQSPRA